MPSYCVKALENTQSILCGLFLVCEHFCSGRTASHRTALDFRGIFVLLDAGGLSPAKEKRAKSTEKTGCPTCVPLLIDAYNCLLKLRFVFSCHAMPYTATVSATAVQPLRLFGLPVSPRRASRPRRGGRCSAWALPRRAGRAALRRRAPRARPRRDRCSPARSTRTARGWSA